MCSTGIATCDSRYFGRGPQIPTLPGAPPRRNLADRVVHRGVAGLRVTNAASCGARRLRHLRDTLSRARVWPDSFPIGGGSARFEAYVSGVPSVHMAPTADPPKGPYEEGSLLELPWLEARNGVAQLTRRVRRDDGAVPASIRPSPNRLVGAQDAVAAAVRDATAGGATCAPAMTTGADRLTHDPHRRFLDNSAAAAGQPVRFPARRAVALPRSRRPARAP